MRKIVRLTERDLTRLVKRVIIENEEEYEEEGWVDFFPLYREKFQDSNDNDKKLIEKKVKVYNKYSDKHDLPGKIIGKCDDGYRYQIIIDRKLDDGKIVKEKTCSNPRDFLITQDDFNKLSEPTIIEKFNEKLENTIKLYGEDEVYNELIITLDTIMNKI